MQRSTIETYNHKRIVIDSSFSYCWVLTHTHTAIPLTKDYETNSSGIHISSRYYLVWMVKLSIELGENTLSIYAFWIYNYMKAFINSCPGWRCSFFVFGKPAQYFVVSGYRTGIWLTNNQLQLTLATKKLVLISSWFFRYIQKFSGKVEFFFGI